MPKLPQLQNYNDPIFNKVKHFEDYESLSSELTSKHGIRQKVDIINTPT